VKQRNLQVNPDQLRIDNDYSINLSRIDEIVKEYQTTETQGIGLVFIMESFNKNLEKGFMWVTFFDIKTKQVLLSVKMEGDAGGVGIRNHWARTFYNVLLKINMKEWSQKYGS
jgi:hypothetical protein